MNISELNIQEALKVLSSLIPTNNKPKDSQLTIHNIFINNLDSETYQVSPFYVLLNDYFTKISKGIKPEQGEVIKCIRSAVIHETFYLLQKKVKKKKNIKDRNKYYKNLSEYSICLINNWLETINFLYPFSCKRIKNCIWCLKELIVEEKGNHSFICLDCQLSNRFEQVMKQSYEKLNLVDELIVNIPHVKDTTKIEKIISKANSLIDEVSKVFSKRILKVVSENTSIQVTENGRPDWSSYQQEIYNRITKGQSFKEIIKESNLPVPSKIRFISASEDVLNKILQEHRK